MPDAPVLGGSAAKKVALDERAFGARFNGPLVHQSVRAEQAARRRGTAATKTRGMVSGGGAKPWRQKGTGRARAGSSRSPIWTGGGVVFGPQPRSYTFKVNRKEQRAALRSALSLHAERGSIAILDAAAFDAPKTSQALDAARRAGAQPAPAGRRWSSLAAEERARGAVVPQPRARRGARARERRRRRHPRRRLAACCSQAALDELTARAPAKRRRSRGRRGLMEHSQVIDPAGRLREELRALRGRQVHLPRPPRRAQDADPPGGRGAVRRSRRRGPHAVSVKSKPKRRGTTSGRTRTWKKAIVQVRAGETIPIFQGLEGLVD